MCMLRACPDDTGKLLQDACMHDGPSRWGLLCAPACLLLERFKLNLCRTNRPITTFLPLAIVLGVSMFKEALEDIQRFQADREVNRRGVLVYSAPSTAWVRKQWRDIVVRFYWPHLHALCGLSKCAHDRVHVTREDCLM